MSNRLITETFPKVKRQRILKKDAKYTPQKKQKSQDFLAVDKKKELELQLLKTFDLDLEFGPCIGITRTERWERAEKHGLHPPKELKDMLEMNSNDKRYAQW